MERYSSMFLAVMDAVLLGPNNCHVPLLPKERFLVLCLAPPGLQLRMELKVDRQRILFVVAGCPQ